MSRRYAVIPAGGAGSRLWPRSRRASPKHLLPLSGSGKPLVQEAYERVRPLVDEVLVLTEERQVDLIRELLPALGREDMIVEPAARGTTNALGLAALSLLRRDPGAVMISLPADHVIRGIGAYRQAVNRALAIAEAGERMVTIGLVPTHPATGFGYIEAGEPVTVARRPALEVRRFVEKPDLVTAQAYVDSRRHYWNLAMFAWRCEVFVEELGRHGPRHLRGLRRVLAARGRGDEEEAGRVYRRLAVEAVDYTVMERTERLLMVPAGFQWVDVGSWTELADVLRADREGNVVDGPAILIDTRDSLVSVPDKLVAVIGMEDLVVVDTIDALLICHKSRAQDVKRVVEALRRSGQSDYL